MKQAEAGKGSRPRPYSIKYNEWSNRWDNIFKKNDEKMFNYNMEVTSGEDEAFKNLESKQTSNNSINSK